MPSGQLSGAMLFRMSKTAAAILTSAGRTGAGWFLSLSIVAATCATPAFAASLHGRAELVEKGSDRRLGTTEIEDAVVFFQPANGRPASPLQRPAKMVTVGKEFRPRVLPVTVGTTVRFPNQDPILHNVFSVSSGNTFDLGFYKQGEGKDWRFERVGLVRVYCNVHYDMVGYILVLDTSHFTSPDARGNFRLDDLPPGPGRLTVWHERAKPWSQQLDVPADGTLDVRLELVRPRVPKHSNKFGKPYQRGDRGQRYR